MLSWFEGPDAPPSRPSRPRATRRPRHVVCVAPQLELHMVPAAPAPMPTAVTKTLRTGVAASAPPPPLARQAFGSWLLNQAKRPGSLGELAKPAKLDRLFPTNGTAEDVRRRFGILGAGDAFEALEDAEREYDRQVP